MSFLSKLEKQKKKDYPAVIRNVNLESFSAGLYSSKAHFIYELLQNAEDAKSSYVAFDLTNDNLTFSNNGHEFTKSNIKAICKFGYSDKKDNSDNIGEFGIGFKSVYSITNTPVIHSGPSNFEIVDFLIPKELNDKKTNQKGSKFILPFNQNKTPSEEAYELLNEEFDEFDPRVFLFLENINTVTMKAPELSSSYLKTTKSMQSM